MTAASPTSCLLVQCRSWLCALPLAEVIETLRPLPLVPVTGAPPFVRGLALVRGELVPVVELGQFLSADGRAGDSGGAGAGGRRLVIVRAAERRLALLVDAVLRVFSQELGAGRKVAPLLSQALPEQVAELGVLDGAALAVLRSGSVLTEAEWATLGMRNAP